MAEFICDELLNVQLCDVAETPLTEAGQDALAEHHAIPTLRGELQSRQDKGCPFAVNEILQVLCCLGPLLTLIEHLQMLVELYLSFPASRNLAEKANYNRTLYASRTTVWPNHVFSPTSDPDFPAFTSLK